MRKLILFFIFTGFPISLFSAGIAAEVETALNWNLPVNQCEPPSAFHGMTLINEEGVRNSTRKLNPGQKRMAARKKANYDNCVIDYKNNLIEEMEMLKSVAQYGLTRGQAETLLVKMAFIQTVIEQPMALPPESATE